jgi:hypothetical protein
VVDPDNPGRWWTVEEADAELERIADAVGRAQAASRASGGNGHAQAARAAVRGIVESLAAEGVVLRDIERGLIDFAARAPGGRGYWLCWLTGEPAVEWWHWPEDGFAGRTPIAEPPA